MRSSITHVGHRGWRYFLFQTKSSTHAPNNEIKKRQCIFFPHIGVFDICFN